MSTLQEIQAVMSGFPRILAWNNFRPVQTSPSPPHLAQTSSSYSMGAWSVALVNGEYRVRGLGITVTLNPNPTWAVSSARTDAALLLHEQGHYDITGLIARDLARKILDLSLDATVVESLRGAGNSPIQHLRYVQQQYQTSINEFGRQATALMNRLQTDPVTGSDGIYDVQTNHGINKTAQMTWNNRFQRIKGADENFELCLALEGII